LNLPGLGAFTLDSSITGSEITEKNAHELVQHIRYNQKNIIKPDDEFIEFIRTHTGKIKPLAESDLESYIAEGKILLNIGKPFHLEGIGTLQKNNAGKYEFTPGLPLLDKIDNIFHEKDTKAPTSKQPYEKEYSTSAENTNSGRTAWLVLAILLGLGAIVWGGYSLYNSNTDNEGLESTPAPSSAAVGSVPDTTATPPIDTLQQATASSSIVNRPSSGKPYKFIFRLASRNYVIKRYNELKISNPNLFWDTKDSIVYRLYVALPVASTDTARIRDSLREWYGTKKVLIEQ
jgi:hypothetical protein